MITAAPQAVIVQPWTHEQAVSLCIRLESVAPAFGCHVGLTGGTLYRDGERKDCDVLLYRVRRRAIDFAGLWAAFASLGVIVEHDFGFCIKASMGAQRIDFLFPEAPAESGDYQRAIP